MNAHSKICLYVIKSLKAFQTNKMALLKPAADSGWILKTGTGNIIHHYTARLNFFMLFL